MVYYDQQFCKKKGDNSKHRKSNFKLSMRAAYKEGIKDGEKRRINLKSF